MDNILLGASWCGPCKRVKEFLDNRGIPYEYLDIDSEEGLTKAKEFKVRSVPAMSIGGTIQVGDSKIMEAFGE